MEHSVAQILRNAAQKFGNKTAAVFLDTEKEAPFPKTEISFTELEQETRIFAAHLQKKGIQQGDYVGLMAENSIGFIRAWFAIQYCGACVVPIPILSAASEVSFRLSKTKAKLLLFDKPREMIAREGSHLTHTQLQLLEANQPVHASDHASFTPQQMQQEDAAMVLFTSGTTGEPKGAVITHEALTKHTQALVSQTLKLNQEDRVLTVLPLTHSFGLRMALLAPWMAGATIYLQPRFRAEKSLQVLAEEKITWLPAVPTMFRAWKQIHPENFRYKPSHLKWCLSAGAPLDKESLEQSQNIVDAEIRQGYGLTEATFSTINAPPDTHIPASVGKPVPGVQIQIVNEQLQTLPHLKQGQIQIKGINLMKEYFNEPEATQKTTHSGWLSTGDLGYLDKQGRLFVVDRIKDLILRGGNNVYPSEVERVLLTHPDIQEAAVIGEPDPYYGENVVAVIVAKTNAQPTLKELCEFCKKHLAPYKAPRKLVCVDQLPLGPSGKVLKRTLRKMLNSGAIKPSLSP